MVSVLRYFDETRQWSQVDAGQVSNIPQAFGSGTTMLFVQAAAPTGWTRVTTFDDRLLRVVGSATPSSGGSNSFSSVNAQTQTGTGSTGTGTSGATTLAIATIPGHTHTYSEETACTARSAGACIGGPVFTTQNTGSTGGGGSHTHTVPSLSVPALSVNFNITYVDALIASKN